MKEKKFKAKKVLRAELIAQAAIGLAGEIIDPLTVIKGYLQLFEKDSFGSNRPDWLDAVYRELDRIEELTTNIISLAKRYNHILNSHENFSRQRGK